MGELAGPLTTDKFQTNHVYQSDSFDIHGHDVRLRIGVFGDSESGYDINYRYYEGKKAGELFSVHTNDPETAGRLFWARLNTLPSGTHVNELYTTPVSNETNQGDRNVTTKPAQEKSTSDNVKEGNQIPATPNKERPNNDKPQTENTKEVYTGGTFLEDVEHWIPSLFQPAQQGIINWKNDLTEYTQDGGSPILGALAATGLDVLDTAMSFTQGIPLGFLDTRNIGEGLAEGTWEGFKRDASRALNVIPQGKILRAVDRAITISNVVENTTSGDYNAAALEAGMTVLAHRKGAKGRSDPKSKYLTQEQVEVTDYLQKSVFNRERFELARGFAKGELGLKNIPSAVSTALHNRAKIDLKKQFGSSVKVENDVPLRKMGDQSIDLEIGSKGNSKIKVELKATAWISDGKIKTPWTIGGKNKSQMKQMAAIQLSARKNPETHNLVLTPKDIFVFNVPERMWVKLE